MASSDAAAAAGGPLPEELWDTDEKAAELLSSLSSSGQLDPLFARSAPLAKTFLRARKGDVEAAGRMLLRHQTWRREVSRPRGWPHCFTRPYLESVRREAESGKAYIRGMDKRGRPLLLVRADLHFPCPTPEDRLGLERFVVLMSECVTALLHRDDLAAEGVPRAEQFVVIIDFGQFGMANMDAEAAKLIVQTLGAHYPEHLGRMYMVSAGWVAWGLWQVVRLMLDARTEKKFAFVEPPALLEDFDASQLPTWLGGSDGYVYSPAHMGLGGGPAGDGDGGDGGDGGGGGDGHGQGGLLAPPYVAVRDGPLNAWLRPIPPESEFYARLEEGAGQVEEGTGTGTGAGAGAAQS